MIKCLTEFIADYFCANEIINEADKEIYIYGLHLIISSVIGISIILTLGLAANKFVITFLFITTFISIRMYSGGYHADSYIKCNLTLISAYLMLIAAVIFTPAELIKTISIILIIITLYVVFKYAPVDNKNKRLTADQKIKNKRITLYLLFLFYITGLFLYKFNIQLFYTIILTMFLVAIFIIGGVANEKNDSEIYS